MIRHSIATMPLYKKTKRCQCVDYPSLPWQNNNILSNLKYTNSLSIWEIVTGYEMIKYKIDILDLCETRWNGSGKMKENGKTIVYSGHSKEQILGVGICLSSLFSNFLIRWKAVNQNIIKHVFKKCMPKSP